MKNRVMSAALLATMLCPVSAQDVVKTDGPAVSSETVWLVQIKGIKG